MAGNTARRTNGNRTELRRGVYSPCDLCKDDPMRPPLWQLKAEKISHDQEMKIVEYRDATLEIAGIPMLYTPYLSHPDPSVRRQSGLLAPTFGSSSSLGQHITIPYYWAIGPDKDFTFTPMFTNRAGQVMAGEYRQRWGFGEMQLSGSAVEDKIVTSPDANGSVQEREAVRGHAFGRGRFSLNEDWRSGFDLKRATDQTYLRRYRFSNIDTFLTSDAYLEGFTQRSYANVTSYSFQTLRSGTEDKTQAIVVPVAGYNWLSRPGSLGDTWRVDANLLNLYRRAGSDSRRASLGGEWQLPLKGAVGDIYTFTAALRGDGYYVNDLPLTPVGPNENGFAGRTYPQVALEWRWPWARTSGSMSEVIEPIAAIIAAPTGLNPTKIPNDDSASFDFGENSLFVRNRFPGYDRVDEGQRVDYGVRTAVYGEGGGRTTLIIGQSYRLQNNTAGFLPGSGLDTQLSDVVGAITVAPDESFDVTYRFRRDTENFRNRRQELTLTGGPSQLRFAVSYLSIPRGTSALQDEDRQELSGSVRLGLTRYWNLTFFGTESFATSETLSSGVAAIYQDECLAFIASLTQSANRDRDLTPGVTVLATVVFKNLGELIAPVFQESPTPR